MIVGFHGKMRAGKNEAAKRLELLSSLPVVEVSFAAKLKQSAAALLGCTVGELEALKNEPNAYVEIGTLYRVDAPLEVRAFGRRTQSVRSFLQRYGTEAHRDIFHPDFWLDAALPTSRIYSDALYVVTDVRFPNEAERIHDLGGMVVGIVGPETNTGTHASEAPLSVDFTIDNTTRDDYHASLDRQLVDLLPAWARERAA